MCTTNTPTAEPDARHDPNGREDLSRAEDPNGREDPEPVRIHYLRPPDRLETYSQRLLLARDDVYVTFLEHVASRQALRLDGETILEPGSPIVWFTFPGAWHDVGRFHDVGGRFTGYYADILRPVRFLSAREWEVTDLFLDVWLGADATTARLLDEDELEQALSRGWIDEDTARTARREAERLLSDAAAGRWPPPVVRAWTLERARAHNPAG